MGDGWLYAMEFCLRLRRFPPQAGLDSGTASLAGWLVLGLTALSIYIGPSLREREKEKRKDRGESKCPNNPHPHLLQAQ